MKRMLLICGIVVTVLAFASASPGQDEPPEIVRMTVHPAPATSPALKYRLLPGFLEQRPGNAAVVYNRMWAERQSVRRDVSENRDEYYSWMEMPLDKLPLEKIQRFVRMTESIYDDYQWASRLETCDWCLPVREGNPLVILLPDIQEKREAARMFCVRARYQIARGQFDEAIDTLRTGYALGRNMGRGEFVVSNLVGIAICGVMSRQLETMIQQPGCPNLYWALSDLPSPLVDTRRAFQAEYDLLYLAYPELLHVDDPVDGAAYAQLWIERMIREPSCWRDNMWDPPTPEQQSELRALLAGMILRGYPMAKRTLIAAGRSPEAIEAMPVAQVVAIYTVRTFNELRDAQFRWFSLPWWQAQARLEKASRHIREQSRRREVIPFGGTLLPAIHAVKFAEARCERTIALLRTIEALRMYAASHDGRLPERLGEVTEAPIPVDPLTGRPIDCKVDGDVAVLDEFYSPSSYKRGKPDRRLEIRMAK